MIRIGGSWDDAGNATQSGNSTSSSDVGLRNDVKELQERLGRLTLLTQAMWELVQAKTGITEEELAAKALEIDLRDGIEDGAMTIVPLRCPSCGRISSSKHWKCLYCGQAFQRPAMG